MKGVMFSHALGKSNQFFWSSLTNPMTVNTFSRKIRTLYCSVLWIHNELDKGHNARTKASIDRPNAYLMSPTNKNPYRSVQQHHPRHAKSSHPELFLQIG
jgi:hypothetical protein